LTDIHSFAGMELTTEVVRNSIFLLLILKFVISLLKIKSFDNSIKNLIIRLLFLSSIISAFKLKMI